MSVEVTIDPGRIARLLRLRNGPVERKLRERTERVEAIAKREAPGHMGDFISSDVVESPRGLQGVITCNHPAVQYVLRGTRPHIIRPRRARALRFEVGGRVVFSKLVHHPGTDANDFLGRALREGR
ncbi:hypothetical protein [Actinacidiphila sp. ITFR-21]|uniref:hypothetical protein n=1 Tax=Actinacidiphila sp. ITFR-21 TaxID=3075199 RepID=UPI00288A0FF5|nr:hypothetical protein [Streptomyces sp. ITFR-21]WNI20285.1 hypothetical protein RLT57_32990 [Streptomyces sp. ITFR-21]